jgi:hypothetical protein
MARATKIGKVSLLIDRTQDSLSMIVGGNPGGDAAPQSIDRLCKCSPKARRVLFGHWLKTKVFQPLWHHGNADKP